MKTLLASTLVLCFVIVAASASAQTLRVTADRANLRDKPSTDGTIVTAVSKGDELEVLDKSGNWYHVRVKPSGAQGYVNALVVEIVQGGSAAPATSSTPPSQVSPQAPRASVQANTDEGFNSGYTDVGPVIGLGNLGGANVSFGGRFEHAFKELPNLGNGILGIQVGVNYYHWSYGVFGTDYGITYIPVVVTANYHFRLDNRKIDPFLGLGFGYQRVSWSNCPGCGFANAGYFVGRAGIRYFFSPSMALYADAGAGDAAVNVGIMIKVSGK